MCPEIDGRVDLRTLPGSVWCYQLDDSHPEVAAKHLSCEYYYSTGPTAAQVRRCTWDSGKNKCRASSPVTCTAQAVASTPSASPSVPLSTTLAQNEAGASMEAPTSSASPLGAEHTTMLALSATLLVVLIIAASLARYRCRISIPAPRTSIGPMAAPDGVEVDVSRAHVKYPAWQRPALPRTLRISRGGSGSRKGHRRSFSYGTVQDWEIAKLQGVLHGGLEGGGTRPAERSTTRPLPLHGRIMPNRMNSMPMSSSAPPSLRIEDALPVVEDGAQRPALWAEL